MAETALISGQNIKIPGDNAYCLTLHASDWQWQVIIFREDGSNEPLSDVEGIAIRHDRLLLSLHDIDSSVEKLAIYMHGQSGTSKAMSACLCDISEQKTYARIDISGQINLLTTVNVLEIYLHNGEWKVRCVMQGYGQAPNPLLAQMRLMDNPRMLPPITDTTLKGHNGIVTLLWKSINEQPNAATRHFMGSQFKSVTDLRIGCLYELDNGQRGLVYSYDTSLEGSFDGVPYIKAYRELNEHREQLRINLSYKHKLHRYLVFVVMVESFNRWDELDVSIGVQLPGTPEQKISPSTLMVKPVIAVAMIDFSQQEAVVMPVNEYFNDLMEMDHAFGWGLPWRNEDNLNNEEEQ